MEGVFRPDRAVDEFILFDDMQYTRRDWRNRNQIKTPQGPIWLTVPVKVKGRYDQTIRETEIDGDDWAAEALEIACRQLRPRTLLRGDGDVIEPFYRQDYPLLTAEPKLP